MQTNFPFPAYLYVVCALRERTTGEIVERAWQAMAESADYREKYGHQKHRHSVMYYALANLTIKAWDVHAAALQQPVPTPRFISILRQRLSHRKAQNLKSSASVPSTEKPVEMDILPPDQFGGQLAWFGPNSNAMNPSFDQQPMFPSMDSSIPDWTLWNSMMQGMTPMVINDVDEKSPFFFP
jgi:hypothetical protein